MLLHILSKYKWDFRFGSSSMGSFPRSSDYCITLWLGALSLSRCRWLVAFLGVGISAFAVYQREFQVLR